MRRNNLPRTPPWFWGYLAVLVIVWIAYWATRGK